MAKSITPFLMFTGAAEEAMNFYVSLFRGSKIEFVEHYGPGEEGPQGSVKRAKFTLNGCDFFCFNSPITHNFTFTPSISIFVECDDEAELQSVFERLSAGGQLLMPLDNYGFSKKFAWLNDRFGVSWQLNLP